MNVWSISALILVTVTDTSTTFTTEHKHYTINMLDCAKFT